MAFSFFMLNVKGLKVNEVGSLKEVEAKCRKTAMGIVGLYLMFYVECFQLQSDSV